MMPSFFDLQRYAATGIASPDMTAYDKMRALAAFGGSTVQTLTGIPPLSFPSDGTPLISLSMIGNGSQTGTPSPQSIIMPTFCGVRTGNLFDKSQTTGIVPGTYINQNGNLVSSTYYYLSYPIKLTVGETYTWSFSSDIVKHSAPTVGFYDSENNLLSVATHGSNISHFSFTVPQGCAYIRASVYKREEVYAFNPMLISGTVEQADAVPLAWYEPYGWAEKITCAGQTVPVYLGQVQTVRRIKKLVLTGGENFAEIASGLYRITENGYMRSANTLISMCSHFGGGYTVPAAPSAKQDTLSFLVSSSGNNFVYFSPSQYLTEADFKAYLAQQYAAGTPVTIWYVLAEPTTGIVNEPLAKIGDYADELHSTDAGVSIPTVKGQNTLTVETDLQPSEMTITYRGEYTN